MAHVSRPVRRRLPPAPIVLPLALLAALLAPAAASPAPARAAAADREVARFDRCPATKRVTCVVDGDTFWYRGDRIRIADINAPELGRPACRSEAVLAERATSRLTELLNAGAFSLVATDRRDRDRYGRLLRSVSRGGRSLGARLAAEGLAEPWTGRRGTWC